MTTCSLTQAETQRTVGKEGKELRGSWGEVQASLTSRAWFSVRWSPALPHAPSVLTKQRCHIDAEDAWSPSSKARRQNLCVDSVTFVGRES